MQLIRWAHHRLITRQMRVHACTRIIFALHLIPIAGDRLCVEHGRYIADDLVPPSHHSLEQPPSSFLRTCLSYLTSNARARALPCIACFLLASDRRHLWPKVCEESFCKTIFLLPALLSSSSRSSPSETTQACSSHSISFIRPWEYCPLFL